MRFTHLPVLLTPLLLALPALGDFTYCEGQGTGNCQFVMIHEAAYLVELYDHACNKIGFDGFVEAGSSISSELPYTVDIVDRGGTAASGEVGIYATFEYAGGEYGTGYSDYARGNCGADGCTGFRVAFPCPGF